MRALFAAKTVMPIAVNASVNATPPQRRRKRKGIGDCAPDQYCLSRRLADGLTNFVEFALRTTPLRQESADASTHEVEVDVPVDRVWIQSQ